MKTANDPMTPAPGETPRAGPEACPEEPWLEPEAGFGSFRHLRVVLNAYLLVRVALPILGLLALVAVIVRLAIVGAPGLVWVGWVGGIIVTTLLTLALLTGLLPWFIAWLIMRPFRKEMKNKRVTRP